MGDTAAYDSSYADQATGELEGDNKKAKKLRSALAQTEGGMSGEEVVQSGKRNNLFGN